MDKAFWKIGLAAAAMVVQAMPAGAAAPGGRGDVRYVEGNGAGWTVRENRHGAVMRRGRLQIFLGRSCDARSSQFGRGHWGWANGGVLITFPRRRIGFPRADPPISGSVLQCRI
jgi:hypothetical protein